jgi:hypothetical protein
LLFEVHNSDEWGSSRHLVTNDYSFRVRLVQNELTGEWAAKHWNKWADTTDFELKDLTDRARKHGIKVPPTPAQTGRTKAKGSARDAF